VVEEGEPTTQNSEEPEDAPAPKSPMFQSSQRPPAGPNRPCSGTRRVTHDCPRAHTPEETKAALHEVVASKCTISIVKGEPPTMTLPGPHQEQHWTLTTHVGACTNTGRSSVQLETPQASRSAKQLLEGASRGGVHRRNDRHRQVKSTLREMYYISEGWGHGKVLARKTRATTSPRTWKWSPSALREDFKLRPRRGRSAHDRQHHPAGTQQACENGCASTRATTWATRGTGCRTTWRIRKVGVALSTMLNFIMAIETGGMFDRLIENGFDEAYHRCALGPPQRPTRTVNTPHPEAHERGVGPARGRLRLTATRGRTASLLPSPTGPSRRRTSRNTSPRPTATYLGITSPTTLKRTTCQATTCQRRDVDALKAELDRSTVPSRCMVARTDQHDAGARQRRPNSSRWPSTALIS